MATETIDIRIREDGARVVNRRLQDVGETATKAADGIDLLKRALGALTAYLAIDKIKQYADAWSSAAGQIRVATKNTEEATSVMEKLFRVAQNTRQGFTSVVELYSRTARAGKELGASQQELIGFTENIGMVLASSATSAQQAQGALMQLGQALGGGVVRAEEFNSILEGAPAILQVVANNIKGANGSIGQLRKIMLDGKLTSREFFDAVMKGSDEIRENFQKSSFTIAQGLTLISNAATKWVGEADKAIGASNAFGNAAKWIATNFDLIAKAAISAAAGFALVGGGAAAINLVTRAVQGLTAAIAMNPLGALLVILTTVITALTLFRDEIKLGTDELTTLGDMMRSFGEVIGPLFKSLADWASETFGPMIDVVRNWFKEVDFSMVGILRLVARVADTFVGTWRGSMAAVVTMFSQLPATLGDLFTQAMNVILGKIGTFVNKAGELLSSVTEFVGLGKIATLDLTMTNENAGAARNFGKNIGDAFAQGFRSSTGVETFLNERIAAAQEIGRNRAMAGAGAGADLTTALGKLSPAQADAKEAAKARKKLNEEIERGMQLTIDEALARDKEHLAVQAYTDSLNNLLETQRRDLAQSVDMLAMSDRQRQNYQSLMKVNEDYQKQLDDLTRQRNTDQISEARYQQELAALQNFYAARIQLEYDSQAKVAAAQNNWLVGANRALNQYQDAAVQTAAATENALTGAFRSAEDALTQFVTKGKLSVASLAESILASFARIAAQRAISGLVGMLAGAIGNVATASMYGTNVGSQQTNMLQEQNAGLMPFAGGGYTGDMGRNQVAGMVHGQEFVFDAASTAYYGADNLQAMMDTAGRGSSSGGGAGGGWGGTVVNFNLIDNVGANVRVQEEQDEQGNTNLNVILDPLESALAERMSARRGPLFKATQGTFGLRSTSGR